MQCSVEIRIKIWIETSFKLCSNTTLLISGATAGLVYARNGPLQQVLRGRKYSILPALSLDGILTLDIFEGSVNRERFIEFLRNSLVIFTFICWQYTLTCIYQAPHLNPYPMDQSVVIMDNCSIHHDDDIRQVIEIECGMCFFEYLTSNPEFFP